MFVRSMTLRFGCLRARRAGSHRPDCLLDNRFRINQVLFIKQSLSGHPSLNRDLSKSIAMPIQIVIHPAGGNRPYETTDAITRDTAEL